jgi:hypothetical protein
MRLPASPNAFPERHGDDNALARGESVSLYNDGCALFAYVFECRTQLTEIAIVRRRDIVSLEKILRKRFRALELRSSGTRSETGKAVFLKAIDHSRDKRYLGSDDR